MDATNYSTTIDTTEIRYSRETRDYDVLDNGRYITSASTYSQAEAKRMEYLSSLLHGETLNRIEELFKQELEPLVALLEQALTESHA